ncbi:hypothetical protein ES703_121782 [subsurface metagenome]
MELFLSSSLIVAKETNGGQITLSTLLILSSSLRIVLTKSMASPTVVFIFQLPAIRGIRILSSYPVINPKRGTALPVRLSTELEQLQSISHRQRHNLCRRKSAQVTRGTGWLREFTYPVGATPLRRQKDGHGVPAVSFEDGWC